MNPAAPPSGPRVVALAGNPNCGKSTLFNALTGLRQKVANYPGVTVERREGLAYDQHGKPLRLIDLPGAYSLHHQSPDEAILRDVLLGKMSDVPRPDIVICVVDASNAERHLFLASQILELGIPAIIVLNMMDIAEARGIRPDAARLSEIFGVPVVTMEATSRKGLAELRIALASNHLKPSLHAAPLPPESLRHLPVLPDGSIDRRHLYLGENGGSPNSATEWRDRITASRYGAIREVCSRAVHIIDPARVHPTERIDQVALHPLLGPIIALLVLTVMFYLIFSFAEIPMGWIESLFGAMSSLVNQWLPEGDLRSLVCDGILAGVSGVVVFLPQILILFFFIGLMEDTGYLPRIAFMMDRIMSRVGLSGKSFVPLLSSHACAVPAIMGARTIEHEKDRLITILVAPLASCSARLPVYLLLIAAMMPTETVPPLTRALILMGLYSGGILGIFLFAWIFNRLLQRTETGPSIMELPTYKLPALTSVAFQMLQRGWLFIKRAGTIILAVTIVLWAANNYPKNDNPALQREQSIAGRLGKAIEPVISPLGFDWKIGIGVIASFAAREVFVSAMAITYEAGEIEDEEGQRMALRQRFREARRDDGSPAFTTLTYVSLMVFYVFAMQCASTTAVVRRETNSWKWALFQFGYMTATAWIASFLVFQGGRLFGFS
ncbi:MAG: ferrous iron transport protein B [Verrucomicrobia bacterium]|nr:MAG: ferrous iron transport protein B [Verrucomicrobiota bacterium]